ncbi:MAG: preprotein translocase subunit SecE [Candidatus Saccharimonas sp.]
MAKSAKGKSKQKSQSRITRITAGDKATKPKKPSILATAKELAGRAQTEKSSAKTAKTSAKTKTAASKPKNSKSRRNPLSAITGYFRGAWQEIKQVRWPDRRSTWGMVGALIVFTAALFLVIILLDYGFAWLFKLIMGTK